MLLSGLNPYGGSSGLQVGGLGSFLMLYLVGLLIGGIGGGITGAIYAAVYNVAAGSIGGLEIDVA